MLIASLPPLHQEALVEDMAKHPLVGGLRYNTGMMSAFSIPETVAALKELSDRHNKPIWIDLKGRQLRIVNWAAPNYGRIVLNHDVQVDGLARVYFRGDECSNIQFTRGNEIFVDPPPRHAVGEGQSINIIGDDVKIKGYLTDGDKAFIKAAVKIDLVRFMLSFVESMHDVEEVADYMRRFNNHKYPRNADLVWKIESQAGLRFVDSLPALNEYGASGNRLMAARDDLSIHIGANKAAMLEAVANIVAKDPYAIAASKIFEGLRTNSEPSVADFSDIELLHRLGYQTFMLSDEVSHRHFKEAIKAWESYQQF
jgi:pyruvate kinase